MNTPDSERATLATSVPPPLWGAGKPPATVPLYGVPDLIALLEHGVIDKQEARRLLGLEGNT